MIELLLHVTFTLNACAILALTIGLVRRRLFPNYIGLRNRFVLLSLLVIAVKICYVALFVLVHPEQVVHADGQRYFFEIQQIAVAPWEWNPILGTGPNYHITPKMGMSYVYGLILFFYSIDSVYTVLVINIVISYFTCVVVFLLTLRVSSAPMPAFTAMFLTAVYPETLFWNARVLRENFTLLLVPALVYSAIRLFESRRPRYLAYLLVLTGLLLITRAQLVLFLPLILAYYAVALLFRGRYKGGRVKTLSTLILLGLLMFAGFGFISQQIRAVAGGRLFHLLQGGSSLWELFSNNIGDVLSLTAREGHGSLGVLLAPFVMITLMLFIAMLLRFRQIFAERCVSAGLMVFLIITYIGVLAVMGLPNIRFRSTVAPLELCLVSVACYYYWRLLKLPRIVVLPI